MGCSYDVFTGKLKQREYNQDFADLWNSVLEDDLYDDVWCTMSLDNFEDDEDGNNSFGIDSEPLFCMMENGEQIIDFLIEFFRKHPDAEFEGEYEVTFNNCGDMNIKYFSYKDGIIHVKSLYSEFPYIESCPECGYEEEDEDEMYSMHDWAEGKTLICKECGCKIDMDVAVDEWDIDIYADEEEDEVE